MDSSTYLTPLPWNGLVPCYIYKASKGPNPSLQMEELQEAPVKSTAGMYCCKVCDKSFSRKDNLSRHVLIHSEKKFQCHHCSKCYSQQGKLKIHQTRHHLDAKPISSKNALVCANCSKMFGRSFNFKRHMAVCKKKSVEATKSDMEAMMLEMTQAERQYRQKLEVGETVSTLLNSNEHLSEESLSNEYKKALKMYRQSQVRHVPVYEHATLKPWQKEVLTFIQQPTHREVIWVVGQKGGEGKTFLQITSSTTTVVDVWLWLTSLLVQRTLPISCQSFHWSVRTSFSSITPVLQQRPLLMTCWKVSRMVTRSVLSMTPEDYFSKHLTLSLSFPMNFQWQGLSRKTDGAFMKS